MPIARSIIAKELVEKYQLKQTEVANYLGVAQAAVSKYIAGKYSDNLRVKIQEMEVKLGDNRKLIDSYIEKIAQGKKEYVNICICTICSVGNGFFCAFSHAAAAKG